MVLRIIDLADTRIGIGYQVNIIEVEKIDDSSARGFEVSIKFEGERMPERTHPDNFKNLDEARQHANTLISCIEAVRPTYEGVKNRLLQNLHETLQQIKTDLFRNACKTA